MYGLRPVQATDAQALLADAAGANAFAIQDAAGPPATMASIDSDGNVMIKGGMRLDAGGVENTTAEYLIVDGAIGIGGTPSSSFLLHKASTTASSSGRVPAGALGDFSLNEGDYWNDSTQKANIDFIDGINQARVGCIFTQTADATVANTTAEVTLVGSGVGTTTLPANFFVAGKTIRVNASGYFSTAGTGSQTLEMRVRLGGISGTVVLDTSAHVASTAYTSRLWQVAGIITCRTTGGSGTVFSQGIFISSTSATAAAIVDMENSTTTTIDTTAAQQIVVSADWNSAAAGDTITCTDLSIEVLN